MDGGICQVSVYYAFNKETIFYKNVKNKKEENKKKKKINFKAK